MVVGGGLVAMQGVGGVAWVVVEVLDLVVAGVLRSVYVGEDAVAPCVGREFVLMVVLSSWLSKEWL